MIKNIFKLKNLSVLIALAGLAYGGYYFGTQNTDTTSNNKTLELTTVAIKKGDLEKKEEYFRFHRLMFPYLYFFVLRCLQKAFFYLHFE